MLALREALKLKPEVIFFLTDADLMTNNDVNEILGGSGFDADPGRRVRARYRAGPANPPGPVGDHHRRLIPLHRREQVPQVEWWFLKETHPRGLPLSAAIRLNRSHSCVWYRRFLQKPCRTPLNVFSLPCYSVSPVTLW